MGGEYECKYNSNHRLNEGKVQSDKRNEKKMRKSFAIQIDKIEFKKTNVRDNNFDVFCFI